MSDSSKGFGARLYSEMRKQSGYDVITAMMDYNAIQQLKRADREGALKLFSGSGYEIIQLLKSEEPELVAQRLVAAAQAAQGDQATLQAATLIMITSI